MVRLPQDRLVKKVLDHCSDYATKFVKSGITDRPVYLLGILLLFLHIVGEIQI